MNEPALLGAAYELGSRSPSCTVLSFFVIGNRGWAVGKNT